MAKRFPVIDGEIGGDVYGHATTARGAKMVANRYYADPAVDAYFNPEPVTLRDGSICPDGAWVATTFPLEDRKEI